MFEKNIGTVLDGVYLIDKEGFASSVPAFCGGESEGIYDGGDNSFIVCIKNALYDDILDYINILNKNGYSEIFRNKIGDNIFYSYSNNSNLIFVYYIASSNSVKLIAEPFYEFTYNEPFEDLVKPAVITSSACDRNYYIRLPDNKLVVIDGGWRIEDWSRYEPIELLEAMYKEMVEICQSEQVNIPLWIITHPHTDHVRVLEYLYKMPFFDKFTIDRILYNFPSEAHLNDVEQAPDEVLQAAQKQLKEWHKRAGKDFPYEDIFYNCPFPVYDTYHYEAVCREAFTHYDSVRIKAHDGMKFNLSGVVFEVLHTPDDDMPTVYKLMNDTSLVIKMTYENSATLWLGDMGVIPGNSCIEMYGDYLKCDSVQVSHHGWGSASWEFFELLKPEILLWNNSEFGFQYADKYQGYGKTESSTRLFNMPCVKQNYFCNTIKMQYIDLPYSFEADKSSEAQCKLLVSAASDRTFMVKLSDSKLIMINGGWRKEMWERYDRQKLLENLFYEMQNFAGTEKVTVAAWIITDAEFNDNNQFLANFTESDFFDKIKIENLIYNFPDISVTEFTQKIGAIPANHITPKTGDNFKLGEADFKILYAPKDGNFDSLRDASTVVMLSVKDEKIVFTGNMTDRISREILSDNVDIECGILQVANHGLENSGVLDFYRKCNARINIWNTSEYAYRFFNPTEGYEKSEVSTAVYNFEHCKNNYFCDRISPQIIPLSLEK